MKTVFSSNSQLCHIWANQAQARGRANNMFFDGVEIYSYGRHYLAAKIHNIGGTTFALVRSDSYGPATSKHLCHIRSSLHRLMQFFCVEDVENPHNALGQLDAEAHGAVSRALKRVKIESQEDINYAFDSIHRAFRRANDLRAILGFELYWPSREVNDKVQAHLEKRLARYHELNTPEMLAARAAEKARREQIEAKKREAERAEQIAKFRAGEVSSVRGLQHELLRVDGDEVVTSAGARVPLVEASRLLADLVSGKNFAETKIGNFRFQNIDRTLADPIVTIGCHRIKLSEALRVLGPVAVGAA